MLMVKTEKGLQVMKDRSVPLSPRQRSAFILFDGRRSVQDVLSATAAMGVTAADVEHLVGQGLLREAVGAAPTAPAEVAAPVQAAAAATPEPAAEGQGSGRSAQQRYMEAYPVAAALTAGLGLRGFRLNLAVEAAASFDDLQKVAPRIRDAVGPEKFAALDRALNG